MHSITVKKYFEIVNPNYTFLKLTPIKSLRNYNSDKILNVVTTLYRQFTQRIQKENNKYFFNAPVKVSYYIYMEKDNIEFFFIIPQEHKTLLLDKIGDTWKGVTVEEVDTVPFFSKDAVKYAMNYKKQDAFSLATDKRNNTLLSAITSTASVLGDKDKIGVLYNFIPTSQGSWRSDYDYIMKKFKEGYPVEKQKLNVIYALKLVGTFLLSASDTIMGAIGGFFGAGTPTETLHRDTVELGSETKRKRESQVIKTQIAVISDSNNKRTAIDNGIAVCESFKTLSSDNELIYKRINKPFELTDLKIKAASFNSTALEAQNFLSLPGKEIIEEHQIKCVDTFQSKVPAEIQQGIFSLGESIYRGIKEPVFLCNDSELRNLSLCIVGANRSGKTTLIANLANDGLKNGECIFVFDFCGNCELTKELKGIFKDKVLEINCSDFENLQGFGFNEVDSNSSNAFVRYDNIKKMAIHLSTLINGINEEDRLLKAKMDRYLESACLVVFMQGGNLKDVFRVLQDHTTRHNYIDNVPQDQQQNLEEYIQYLYELDDKSKSGEVVGTKLNNIVGIIDRLNLLKKNTYVELMLKKDCKSNIDLVKEMQKPQIISIKMPEDMFATSQEKDIFVSYWWSKIWLSLQIRKTTIDRAKHRKLNIFIDELYQVPKCQKLIADKLSQMPKFTAKLIVSCHMLGDISAIQSALKASNSTYVIFQGSDISNFRYLKSEFENLGYTAEDLLNLKRWHMLNLIKYQNGYWAGVTYRKPLIVFTT